MTNLKFILIFVLGYAIYFFVDGFYFSDIQTAITTATHIKAMGHIGAYSLTLTPLLITLCILHKNSISILDSLGLSKNIFIGLVFGFSCALPMLIGYTIKLNVNAELSINTIIINAISSAFFEEVIYRAFLFGQLYRFTKLGFIPSVFLGSCLFGVAHLYQSTDSNEIIGIFALTFLGSVLFGWIYAEWKFNLYTAIFLHCFMNLFWLIFDVDNNALGGTCGNLFRFSTVFLAIFGTIVYKKYNKIEFEVTGKKWWIKKIQYIKPIKINNFYCNTSIK